MQNFIYCTPTKLVFGKGVISSLKKELKPYGSKVLMTYGGGSIKRSGLYDEVKRLLKDDFEIVELANIAPNPKYTSVVEGVNLCKKHHVEVILAVGGGSVLDCSKAIAAGAKYDGEPWDLISYKVKAKAALPIVDIMTMAATGSEYDSGGVISREDTNDKIGYMDELLFPKVSFVDPTYTFTIPERQTVAGVADAMNHIMEQYFAADSTMLMDSIMESALKSLMVNVKKVLVNPKDYNARGEIFLNCSLACNGIYSLGTSYSGWPMHAIEHALSAYYDITHGIGLAIITPRWMQKIVDLGKTERLIQYGEHVFNIDSSLSDTEKIKLAISKTYDFFASLNIPMHLKEVGIDEKRVKEMAHHIAINEGLDNPNIYCPLSEQDIEDIINNSL